MSVPKPFSFDDTPDDLSEDVVATDFGGPEVEAPEPVVTHDSHHHDASATHPPTAAHTVQQPVHAPQAATQHVAPPVAAATVTPKPQPADFSQQFDSLTPSEVFSRMSAFASQRGVSEFDAYGNDSPHLNAFEAEVSRMLGCKDGVFFLTGSMAQQVAIDLHRADTRSAVLLAHPSSHPVHLTSLENGVEQTRDFAAHAKANLPQSDVRPVGAIHRVLTHADISDYLATQQKQWFTGLQQEHANYARAVAQAKEKAGTFGTMFGANPEEGLTKPAPLPDVDSFRLPGLMIIEMPQRMNGGATMSLADLMQTRALTKSRGLRLHMDGARLWDVVEALGCPLRDICSYFDSVYVSFYKGIGSIGGAMLLGDTDFCARARLARHQRGGAAFTLMPYVLHSQMCFRDNITTFGNRLDTCRAMVGLVKAQAALLSAIHGDHECEHIVRFEPRVPQASMVHCYLFAPKAHIERAHAAVMTATGCRLFNRLRGRGYIADAEPQPATVSAESWYFEWSFGAKNGSIDAELIVEPWNIFLTQLIEMRRQATPGQAKAPVKGKK